MRSRALTRHFVVRTVEHADSSRPRLADLEPSAATDRRRRACRTGRSIDGTARRAVRIPRSTGLEAPMGSSDPSFASPISAADRAGGPAGSAPSNHLHCHVRAVPFRVRTLFHGANVVEYSTQAHERGPYGDPSGQCGDRYMIKAKTAFGCDRRDAGAAASSRASDGGTSRSRRQAVRSGPEQRG
jgi:hypothetical protein